MLSRLAAVPAILLAAGCAAGAAGVGGPGTKPQRSEPGFEERIAGLEARRGLLDFYLDRRSGKVWLAVPPARGEGGRVGEYLYIEGLVAGLGSNPVGLDRGQLGETRVVALRRVGGRLLVEQQNLAFRAGTENRAEERAVRESFATSVLWAGEIAATAADGRGLVDLTPFLIRDAHGIAGTLAATGQGHYSLDEARSAVDLDACLAFPDNLEFEAILTFAGSEPGPEVEATVPWPEAITLVLHQSLVRLPDAGYRPRSFDPRTGSIPLGFTDYAAPLDEAVDRRWIIRHRLEKADPEAEESTVLEPIVYYVDPAAPEPVRSALIAGAAWWSEAFAEAGFRNAFRVEFLPEGAHPLDVRYNVIQWVHRATRGWSYGGGVVDPRTGEMIKGHVRLGSLRVRQDRRIFEGLAGTAKTGTGAPDDPVELALARIRQLAAHEVGHTLGLTHNFAASTYGRASVMDYPAPWVLLGPGGELDFRQAYAVGVGEWDRHAIRYAYSQFPPGTDEEAALQEIAHQGLERGLVFLSDPDARPPGASHPAASLWDNGADPAAELERLMEVRRRALAAFGPGNVAPGAPLATLEEVFATVYLHHRYQLEAAAKLVGGMEYRYGLRADGQPPARPVAAPRQRQGLTAVLSTLDPEFLDIPEGVLEVLLPRPFGYGPHRELFASRTSPAFDALGAAATAAGLTVDALLQLQRAARLADFHRRDPSLPGLEEVLDALVETSFGATGPAGPRRAAIRRAVQEVTTAALLRLARNAEAPASVRAPVEAALEALAARLEGGPAPGPVEAAHRARLRREIRRYLGRVETDGTAPAAPPAPPPGPPIGAGPAPDFGGCSGPAFLAAGRPR